MLSFDFLQWLLPALGAVYLVTTSAIGSPFRVALGTVLHSYPLARGWLRILIYCPACVGFWIGLAFWSYWPAYDSTTATGVVRSFLSSGLALMAIASLIADIWPKNQWLAEAYAWGVEPEENDAQEEEERDGGE